MKIRERVKILDMIKSKTSDQKAWKYKCHTVEV